jgi:hypothetical protein
MTMVGGIEYAAGVRQLTRKQGAEVYSTPKEGSPSKQLLDESSMGSAMSDEDVTDEVAAAAAKLLQSPTTGSAKSVRFSKEVADESAQILARSRSQLKNKGWAAGSSKQAAPAGTSRLVTGNLKSVALSPNSPQKGRGRGRPAGTAWTEDEIALLKKMRSEGESWDEIEAVNQSSIICPSSFLRAFPRLFPRGRYHL